MSDNCIFCKIARGEIPSSVVFQDDDLLAFRDINPSAPTHILVIPRRHVTSTDELVDSDASLVGKIVLTAAKIARDEKIADGGYRLVTNTNADGGQSVAHLHFHLLGGRKMSWPPG